MTENENLTESENKTRKLLYTVVGRKIAEARKSSRRKLEGISKKLNISTDILKKIESGEIANTDTEIPITGFIRAYAKLTNAEISEELEKLQSNYFVDGKVKNLYKAGSNIKASKIFVVFIASFSFLLFILYFFNANQDKKELTINETNDLTTKEYFLENDTVQSVDEQNEFFINKSIQSKKVKVDDSFFEIIFLEETWIEIYNKDKDLLNSGLYKVGQSIDFTFDSVDSDFFIKSGNLGGFQIFFKDEFFAPFGYSGEVNKGFYLIEKIEKIKRMRL